MIWVFTAVLWAGILAMRAESRWALTAFDTALFTMAGVAIVRQRLALRIHPIGAILAAIAAFGLMQVAAGITADVQKTLESSLNWSANCAAFCLALRLAKDRATRQSFLTAQLIFALVVAIGAVIWLFTLGSLGPFVYRNQFAAFLEPALGLAIAAAVGDRARPVRWVFIAGALFAAVVAAGSRTGSAICLALLIALPLFAYLRGVISAGSLVRVSLLGAAAAFALVAVAGWQTIWERLQEPNPYGVRADLNRSSLDMVRDRPLAGFGLGTWSSVYPKYARYDDGTFVNQAHDDWAQWAVEGGLPLFIAMLAVVAMLAPKAARSLWGMGLIAVFVHAAVDYPFEQRPALAAYLFALMGVLAAEERSGRLAAPTESGL
ncbi:MAG TPA: O-antigen ligase family protein [Bryobacteraceae bacterium]|nr:O-antigen ligase family protein [Bryobacteraceae bacterium]